MLLEVKEEKKRRCNWKVEVTSYEGEKLLIYIIAGNENAK